MELAADICSSGVNDIGNIYLLGYKGCISVWRFPHRELIIFLTFDEVIHEVSVITFLPNLSSNTNALFICVAENKTHLLEITPKKQTLSPIDQTSDPSLPPVRAISQLIVTPINHYVLMHLVNGEKVLRDIADTVPGVIALLPTVPTHDTVFCWYLHPTARQLYSIVCDTESGSRRLIQYDLSSVVNRAIIPEIEDKPKPIPESLHSTKRGIFIPGTNSIQKHAMERVMAIYNNREATRKKAKEIWDNLENDLPPTP
ncbi:hypothetical protein LOD99_14095 [Oopsacas minuta]|uniref:Uncharacterized protein n=1 Tax=Oopsacas minuta TaxID=111878 RepID=A0AAV7KHD4_9METZ|nr:hypothetical protein LOD99_14095 [Oopsacas minuta]